MGCPNKLFWFTLHYDVLSVSYLANVARVSVVSILMQLWFVISSLSILLVMYVTSLAHAPEYIN